MNDKRWKNCCVRTTSQSKVEYKVVLKATKTSQLKFRASNNLHFLMFLINCCFNFCWRTNPHSSWKSQSKKMSGTEKMNVLNHAQLVLNEWRKWSFRTRHNVCKRGNETFYVLWTKSKVIDLCIEIKNQSGSLKWFKSRKLRITGVQKEIKLNVYREKQFKVW